MFFLLKKMVVLLVIKFPIWRPTNLVAEEWDDADLGEESRAAERLRKLTRVARWQAEKSMGQTGYVPFPGSEERTGSGSRLFQMFSPSLKESHSKAPTLVGLQNLNHPS